MRCATQRLHSLEEGQGGGEGKVGSGGIQNTQELFQHETYVRIYIHSLTYKVDMGVQPVIFKVGALCGYTYMYIMY